MSLVPSECGVEPNGIDSLNSIVEFLRVHVGGEVKRHLLWVGIHHQCLRSAVAVVDAEAALCGRGQASGW